MILCSVYVFRQVFDDLVRFVRASYVETDDERMARMNKVCVGSCIGRTLTARRY